MLAGLNKSYPSAGMAMNQVMILIDANGTTVAELARRAGMTKQSMAESVANLEAMGLVERAQHPGDRRAKLVLLTDEGWTAIRDGFAVAMCIQQRWTTLVGRDAMNELTTLLERLVDLLDDAANTVP